MMQGRTVVKSEVSERWAEGHIGDVELDEFRMGVCELDIGLVSECM